MVESTIYWFCFLFAQVQELESSDQVSERFNVVQQEKLTLDGRVIQLESMIRQKDEVSVSSLRGRGGEWKGMGGKGVLPVGASLLEFKHPIRQDDFNFYQQTSVLDRLLKSLKEKVNLIVPYSKKSW